MVSEAFYLTSSCSEEADREEEGVNFNRPVPSRIPNTEALVRPESSDEASERLVV